MVRHSNIIQYDEIWGDEPKPWKEYLKGIGRPTLIKLASHFLGLQSNNLQREMVDIFLDRYFRTSNSLTRDWIRSVLHQKLDQYDAVTLIFPASVLHIFSYAYTLDENTVDVLDLNTAELNIFKAFLALNQELIEFERTSQTPIIEKYVPSELVLACLLITQTFAYGDFHNYFILHKYNVQIVKAVLLFEYMESHPEYSQILPEFLSYYNCSDWREFMRDITHLGLKMLEKKQEGSLELTIESDRPDYAKICAFLEKLIYEGKSDIDNKLYDFKSVRDKPIYKIEEGRYGIVFDLFVIEKIYKSQYFLLKDIFDKKLTEENKAELKSKYKIGNFRSHLTLNFSERHLLYSIMKESFPAYNNLSGDDFKHLGMSKGEPDYYLRKGNDVFLFESKDNLILAATKTSSCFQKYFKEFRSRLYNDKGVSQLRNSIDLLMNRSLKTNDGLESADVNALRIFSILVVHDAQFNALGLNSLVNYWFYEAQGEQYNQNNKITSLIILDIDTLILYSTHFKNGTVVLEDAITSYLAYISAPKSKEEFTSSYVSFSHYLQNNYPITPKQPDIFFECVEKFLTQ